MYLKWMKIEPRNIKVQEAMVCKEINKHMNRFEFVLPIQMSNDKI